MNVPVPETLTPPEALTVTMKVSSANSGLPSVSVTRKVMVVMPVCPTAGVTWTVRLGPLPPSTTLAVGTSVVSLEVRVTIRLPAASCRSPTVKPSTLVEVSRGDGLVTDVGDGGRSIAAAAVHRDGRGEVRGDARSLAVLKIDPLGEEVRFAPGEIREGELRDAARARGRPRVGDGESDAPRCGFVGEGTSPEEAASLSAVEGRDGRVVRQGEAETGEVRDVRGRDGDGQRATPAGGHTCHRNAGRHRGRGHGDGKRLGILAQTVVVRGRERDVRGAGGGAPRSRSRIALIQFR